MANWPDSAQKFSNDCYYKVATSGNEILVGRTENDIDYNYKGLKDHAHYIRKNGEWGVRTTVGSVHQEIVAKYGGKDYGNSLYGTTAAPVDEEFSRWLDALQD